MDKSKRNLVREDYIGLIRQCTEDIYKEILDSLDPDFAGKHTLARSMPFVLNKLDEIHTYCKELDERRTQS